jgi:hypothetical protein
MCGVAALLLCGAGLEEAVASDAVVITSEKKLVDPGKADEGRGTKGSETFLYILTFQNQTLADISGLKIDYAIFVQRPKLKAPVTDPGPVDKITGSGTIDILTNRTPQTISTSQFKLERKNLKPGFYYERGGRIKAEDSVVGVWVRVTQNGQLVGEYTNPPTVKNRGWNVSP